MDRTRGQVTYFPQVQERGKERLKNWALWARLDSSDTGYPSRCSYYTPPRTGEVYDEDVLPDIDYREAERTDKAIVGMAYSSRRAVKLYYLEQAKMRAICDDLALSFDAVVKLLKDAETEVGRG